MQIPFEPILFGKKINVHLILEYVAFFSAFRYYLYLRRQSTDIISTSNRLSIILGATLGALLGSRIMGFLEYPFLEFSTTNILKLLQVKTIMGGLFGGLLGVEITKWKIKETNSSGDLFTRPIIAGIFIGRIGCFLSGTTEFTYGTITHSIFGMDLGDGLMRHPIALYELLFLLMLFFFIRKLSRSKDLERGLIFKYFMLLYFGFRFVIEFMKPNEFLLLGLSSIQWLCMVCYLYYYKTILNIFGYAHQKVHIL